MSTPYLKTLGDLANATTGTTLSIIDFTATWCGPCKVIAPTFTKLATVYKDTMKFYKVDVDDSPEIAQHFGIRAMPTFVVLKGATKLDEAKGPTPAALEALVKKHASTAGAASGSSSAAVEKGLEGFASLNGAIETPQVTCLNEAADHTIRDLLKGGGDKWLESDSDEQLLLQIPMQAARIRALRFTTLPSAFAQAPKTVRLFVNNLTLGFDDAESLEPAQELVLSEAQARGEEAVQLRFVRFQSVSGLSIFVVNNQGGEDVTRIDKLELIGSLIDGTDMKALSKGEHDHEH